MQDRCPLRGALTPMENAHSFMGACGHVLCGDCLHGDQPVVGPWKGCLSAEQQHQGPWPEAAASPCWEEMVETPYTQ